jgi:hypothetical protein
MKTPKLLQQILVCIILVFSTFSYGQDGDSKIRLVFDSPTGYHRQILLGINENTTHGFDFGYDAPLADLAKEDMFWCFDGGKYVIQGIPEFEEDQQFIIGLVIAEKGIAKISIDNFSNFDTNKGLYIYDNETGKSYNLFEEPFETELEPGEYMERFSVGLKPSLATLNELTLEEGIQLYMNNQTAELQVKKIVDTEIIDINVFNYLGQRVKNWTQGLDTNELYLPIEVNTGVYIVDVTTSDGRINKKVIIQ